MAKAVEFRGFTPRDSRDDLIRRLEAAPVEHTEALLALYEKRHDKGLIDLLNGLRIAGDSIMDRVAQMMSTKEGVATLRTTSTVANLVASINPDQLRDVIAEAEQKDPPSLLSISENYISGGQARPAVAVGFLASPRGGRFGFRRNQGRSQRPYA